MITRLEALKKKHGDLPVAIKIPDKDDFFVSKETYCQTIYYGPFGIVEQLSIIISADDE